MRRKHTILGFSVLIVLLTSLFLLANDKTVPLDKQADVLLKVLGYERSLAGREGDLRIGIVYTERDLESKKAWQEFAASLDKLGGTVGGRKVSYSILEFRSEERLKTMASMLGVSVFYVTPGNLGNLAAISRVAKEIGILTFSGVEDYIPNGIAVGVENSEGKTKIIIHLPSAKAQGARFSADLLNVAKVIP